MNAIPYFNSEPDLYHKLTLAHNNISDLTSNAFNGIRFEVLDLSQNIIGRIHDEAFVGLENDLTELILEVKAMNTFPTAALSVLVNLQKLTIRNFQLDQLPMDALSDLLKLNELNILDCKMTKITANDLRIQRHNLKSLDLTANLIPTLPTDALASLTNLEKLYLSKNQISSIPSNGFTPEHQIK